MKKTKLDSNIDFVITGDSSVGLYNHEVCDIYHSSYGAKTEAKEKFLTPLNFKKNYFNKNEIKILDICFGIGYNTKVILDEIINSNYQGKVHIDALEFDKKLVLISPFIKDEIYSKAPSYILLNKLEEEILENKDYIQKVLTNRSNSCYFSRPTINLIKKYAYFEGKYNPEDKFKRFLHNIYYQCIPKRNKKPLKPKRLSNITLQVHTADARKTLLSLSNSYDIVFLDAFTPQKLPTLWSLELFNELYRLAGDDCSLVTYSNSAAVRNAMVQSGFYVGKTYDKKHKPCGTIASKNKSMILNPLNEFESGLLKTSAGIYFSDPDLNSAPEEILEEREKRKISLNLESSSHYIKKNNRTH